VESNPFDELFPSNFDYPEQETEEGKRIDYLIHQVFCQNDSGSELIKIWQKALIMQPTVNPGATREEHGINEGCKKFIRNILLTIERVENE